MSESQEQMGMVERTIRDLLPTLNAGLNWEEILERYDANPSHTVMAIQFADKEGAEVKEQVLLGIKPGPEITVFDEVPEDYTFLGAIETYQDYGIRILDPDDDMTPATARYTMNGVTIRPVEGESKERLWLVGSNVLESMLQSIIWKQNNGGGAGGGQ